MRKLSIHITAHINDLLESGFSPFKQYILKTCVKILEKYAGVNIVFPVPPPLQLFDGSSTDMWDTINITHSLKSLGIIKGLKKKEYYPDEPRCFSYRTISNSRYAAGGGSDFLDKKKAVWKALGESVERHLWRHFDFFSKNKTIKPYKEIKKDALDIFSLAGFSEEQKQKHKELQFTENTPFAWVPATSLTAEKEIMCPLQLASSMYFRENVRTPLRKKNTTEPMLRWGITTGLATGKNLEDALVSGILEVIERDAFMITYLNKLSPPIINLEHLAKQDNDIDIILKKFKRYKLDVHLISLPTNFPVFITMALVIDSSERGPMVCVSASADFDLKTCIIDTLSESISVRLGVKNVYTNEINMDRVGRSERLIYWAQKESTESIDFLTRGKKINLQLQKNYTDKNSNRHDKKQLSILIDEFKKQNLETCYIELSSKETKSLGFRTVFVVIPELQPMHLDEVIPYFGGTRLKTVPQKLGYTSSNELNREPHPFP